ncbi:hypothetical protein [Actinomadura litoris]|uniref:hypothetical protein n=1 Tax=Actinomadura litoris TaxID=2678616 RepID=UPI001FA7FAE8|nr:hypothetical protein [Actinomadura litoris]
MRSFTPYGVNAVLYRPANSGLRAVDTRLLAFGDPCLPWARAGQLIMTLRDFVVVA